MNASKVAYVLDFDGTITERDITREMARHYGGKHYDECSAAYRRGEFGMKGWLARMSAHLPPDPAELLAFAGIRAGLRPGLKEFFIFARARGRPLYIASDGFGLYIEPILERHGCREYVSGIFCNETIAAGGRLETLTPHAHRSCPVCGNCKAALVIALREKGFRVLYVGDGFNDRFAAAYADGIYARDRLAEICTAAGLPFKRWDHFLDLLGDDQLAGEQGNHRFCDPQEVAGVDLRSNNSGGIQMKKIVSGVTIECIRGDIVAQPDLEVIVNAANAQLRSGGGVAGAIHRAAGPRLEEECRLLAPIKPGEAVISGGYNLPNRHVIHCLGPVYGRDRPEAELLANCYRNALRLAEENELESIGFPAISTGSFGYPAEEAAQVACRAIAETAPALKRVKTIRFVLFSESDLAVHRKALESLK